MYELNKLSIISIFLLGAILGSVGERYVHKCEPHLIGYINQERLIQLENKRVEELKESDLFLGKSKEAAENLKNILETLSKENEIILITKGTIDEVDDLTDQVHLLLLESLK
ncbi:MAG: hypothetical protein K0R02_705 [Rickettsiaceae bacterium]|jgi:hypothetical protein|nr:hypothetical protein [Rickettsiaceae bacterium]